MKILLIAYYFPPYNVSGAVRVGKFAKFLIMQGHEVRVLAAKDPPVVEGLPLEIDKNLITYTRWFNVNYFPEMVFGGRKKVSSQGYSTKSTRLKTLGQLYRILFNFPDEQIGWLPYALKAGHKIIQVWKPDLLYASGLPATTLIVGSRLSQETKIPWVAEQRDLWIDEAFYPYPKWRLNIERRIERSVLSSAKAMVTVSEPWAEVLSDRFGTRVITAMNGYDPADFVSLDSDQQINSDQLQILYTGTYYPNFHNITPLFRALNFLGSEAQKIRIVFYTRYTQPLIDAAERAGVRNLVSAQGRIEYRQSLEAQVQADILLLFLWGNPSHPEEQGMIPAKMFEYLGSRRPILALSLGKDFASQVIRDRQAGLVSNDPSEIAQQLKTWIDQKANIGRIPPLPLEVRKGFSRDEQYEKILDLLMRINKG